MWEHATRDMKVPFRSLLQFLPGAATAIGATMLPLTASAYIDPGAGVTSITTVVVVGGIVLLLVAGLLWYPLKKLLSKNKDKQSDSDTSNQ